MQSKRLSNSELTNEEIRILLFLVRNRLRYESKRPARYLVEGQDIQAKKVWDLKELAEKLEGMV